ncbi:MAG: uL15 family ribosomal protein [Candidatus Paceibacterota bacterium]
MQLHELQPKTETRSKRRIGRGGKRGTTSGRGQKGQKARAGRNMRPGARDLVLRTPKKRGRGRNKNNPKSPKVLAISLKRISILPEVQITKEVLLAHRIIRSLTQPLKIVASGSILNAKEIKGITVSSSARIKIEKAKGSVA